MKRIVLILAAVTLLLGYAAISSADATVAGTYINQSNTREYLTLNSDGTFYLKQRDRFAGPEAPYSSVDGKYQVTGKDVKLILTNGGESSGTLEGNKFTDAEGKIWSKGQDPTPVNREVRKGKK